MRGRFITLEGGEGAGKSTHARFIVEWLVKRDRQATLTREPGGSPLAEAIRELVLEQWPEGMPITAEVLLMFAARSAHLQATILPALAQGRDVVCDRFIDSSYAYQGAAGGISVDHLSQLEQLTLNGLQPDLTLVFDLDPQQGLQRTGRRGVENRFEASTADYLERVRLGFLDRAMRNPERCVVIDAAGEIAQVQTQLEKVLEQRL